MDTDLKTSSPIKFPAYDKLNEMELSFWRIHFLLTFRCRHRQVVVA